MFNDAISKIAENAREASRSRSPVNRKMMIYE